MCNIICIIYICIKHPIINESNIIILRTRLKQGNSVITRNISNILFYLLKKFFINKKFVNIP